MRRILTMLLVTALLASCVDGRFQKKSFTSAKCGANMQGYTVTYVAYGDSKLVVIPLSKIKERTEWRFILRPLQLSKARPNVDFKNSTVTIKGKRSPEDDWISESGTYNGTAADKHTLIECIGTGLAEPTYFYMVEVEDVGELDPRADVYE